MVSDRLPNTHRYGRDIWGVVSLCTPQWVFGSCRVVGERCKHLTKKRRHNRGIVVMWWAHSKRIIHLRDGKHCNRLKIQKTATARPWKSHECESEAKHCTSMAKKCSKPHGSRCLCFGRCYVFKTMDRLFPYFCPLRVPTFRVLANHWTVQTERQYDACF